MKAVCMILAVAGSATLLTGTAASGAVVTQWNFNGSDATSVPGGNNTPTPSTGSGSASLIGGTTASYASGIASGGSTDPVTTSPANFGWGTTSYPAAAASNETAGVQFLVSTSGYENITISWDQRHSNTASRFWAFYYTLDGSTWNRLGVSASNATAGMTPSGGNPASTAGLFGPGGTFSAFDGSVSGSGDDWFNGRGVDLSSISGANDNPNFGFRIVSSFDNGAAYSASSGGSYATTGTSRFDMVTITGTQVPTPGATALLGLGGLIAARRRRD